MFLRVYKLTIMNIYAYVQHEIQHSLSLGSW